MKQDKSIKSEIHKLMKWVQQEEADAQKEGWGVAPAPYESLAILYRKNKDYAAEVEILERYARQPHAPGVKPAQLMERLEKSRKLLASLANEK